ncbi:hypothetical protein PC9H_006684 [Pleurotus ostreatus]|uniref:Uncharacterized protein n=2 Tax=Pleurotus ostreatus TaxID=5322 RepID=A0A067NET4_PLEO1|nr:uncharacterized protein PC9H_006684 [Pleurotus ostreatus]KAF7430969.1 hypothetical protein PC9H_006684 [Pleurotus ostreatus]KDQ26558.1 hypothetical protein PLEOSDRAFT_1084416 [Pleurotus ostreatus PC15]
MTEYDYSPEAYERYMAKQHSIANWVSKTNSYPPANPFVPTTPAVQAKSLQRDMTRSNTSPAVAYPAHGNQPYVHSGKQPLVVPIGGGQYVVVPPKGTRMEMMHQAKYPQYIPQPAPIPVPPPVMPSPTKQQPLLKRLFTGLTRGGSKQTSNGSGMFGKGRRGRRNSY